MSLHNSQPLRNLQDNVRNSGWRIQWIPWQAPNQVEYVYNTPLTLLTGFGGAALFFVSVYFLVTGHTQWPALAAALTGLLIIFLGRIYAAFNKQAGWLCITAQCTDKELQQRHFTHEGNTRIIWEYRLLCTFIHDGHNYTVTPEPSSIAGFQTRELIEQYLQQRIQQDHTCLLWIDPKNPLHAIFDKKQRI